MDEKKLREVLDFLYRIGACKFLRGNSNCDCTYIFTYNKWRTFSFDKNIADSLPPNVVVSFSQAKEDYDVDEILLEFYKKDNPLGVVTF
jgi:hypothetical protein